MQATSGSAPAGRKGPPKGSAGRAAMIQGKTHVAQILVRCSTKRKNTEIGNVHLQMAAKQ